MLIIVHRRKEHSTPPFSFFMFTVLAGSRAFIFPFLLLPAFAHSQELLCVYLLHSYYFVLFLLLSIFYSRFFRDLL